MAYSFIRALSNLASADTANQQKQEEFNKFLIALTGALPQEASVFKGQQATPEQVTAQRQKEGLTENQPLFKAEASNPVANLMGKNFYVPGKSPEELLKFNKAKAEYDEYMNPDAVKLRKLKSDTDLMQSQQAFDVASAMTKNPKLKLFADFDRKSREDAQEIFNKLLTSASSSVKFDPNAIVKVKTKDGKTLEITAIKQLELQALNMAYEKNQGEYSLTGKLIYGIDPAKFMEEFQGALGVVQNYVPTGGSSTMTGTNPINNTGEFSTEKKYARAIKNFVPSVSAGASLANQDAWKSFQAFLSELLGKNVPLTQNVPNVIQNTTPNPSLIPFQYLDAIIKKIMGSGNSNTVGANVGNQLFQRAQ